MKIDSISFDVVGADDGTQSPWFGQGDYGGKPEDIINDDVPIASYRGNYFDPEPETAYGADELDPNLLDLNALGIDAPMPVASDQPCHLGWDELGADVFGWSPFTALQNAVKKVAPAVRVAFKPNTAQIAAAQQAAARAAQARAAAAAAASARSGPTAAQKAQAAAAQQAAARAAAANMQRAQAAAAAQRAAAQKAAAAAAAANQQRAQAAAAAQRAAAQKAAAAAAAANQQRAQAAAAAQRAAAQRTATAAAQKAAQEAAARAAAQRTAAAQKAAQEAAARAAQQAAAQAAAQRAAQAAAEAASRRGAEEAAARAAAARQTSAATQALANSNIVKQVPGGAALVFPPTGIPMAAGLAAAAGIAAAVKSTIPSQALAAQKIAVNTYNLANTPGPDQKAAQVSLAAMAMAANSRKAEADAAAPPEQPKIVPVLIPPAAPPAAPNLPTMPFGGRRVSNVFGRRRLTYDVSPMGYVATYVTQ